MTVPFCCGCGICEPCRLGETQVCERDFQPGFTAWGSFAEYVALPQADLNLVAVPAALSRRRGRVAGLPLHDRVGGAARPRRRAGGRVGARVHGCGGVGLAAVMIAAAAGAQVVAVDIDPRKLERARALGAAHAVLRRSGGGDPRADRRRRARVPGRARAPGHLRELRVAACAGAGRHAQVGLLVGDARSVALPMARVIGHELRVLGVHGMAVRHYDGMLRAIAAGAVPAGRARGQDDRAGRGRGRAGVDGPLRTGGRDRRGAVTGRGRLRA